MKRKWPFLSPIVACTADEDEPEPIPCPECNGEGVRAGARCGNCDGAKRLHPWTAWKQESEQ